MVDLGELVKKHHIDHVRFHVRALNEACPVAAVNEGFSPERIALLAGSHPDALVKSPLVWDCLTCGLCREVTAGVVDMSCFIRDVRREAVKAGLSVPTSHGGVLMAAQRLSANRGLRPNRTGWITEPLEVLSGKGSHLYWVGSAPLLDAALPELKPKALDSARGAIRLLNRLGVRPAVLEDERPSGHDLLWTGDMENFKTVAQLNMEAIKKSRARTVIVSSPEDYHTLAKSYTAYFGGLTAEVCHITEFIGANLSRLKFTEWRQRVAYHDPCRLGRGMGVYEAPREILRAIPGVEMVEMKKTRENAPCCGTSCWINCNRYAKLMQVNRLREAVTAGAEILATTCWACATHFRCAIRPESWRQVSVDVRDVIAAAASHLRG
jgi:Fe-S oxidoreductase